MLLKNAKTIFNMMKFAGHRCLHREYVLSWTNLDLPPFDTFPSTRSSYGYVNFEGKGADHPLAMNGVDCSGEYLNFAVR